MPAPANKPTAPRDLSHAELQELEELLGETPQPLQPLDIVMLEGYLCGILVEPVLIDAARWMPPIFDVDGAPLPDTVPAAWRQRITALVLRYHAALNHRLVDPGWFDPLVFEDEQETPAAADAPATDPLRTPSRIFAPLWPWVAGFHHAVLQFPALAECGDDAVADLLERVFRHLPAQTDDERQQIGLIESEYPLDTLDEAIEDLVLNVVELFDLTQDARYKVAAVKRDVPKVGRNDACPCGSGRKYKHCHGA
jgi:uncharacterized protein